MAQADKSRQRDEDEDVIYTVVVNHEEQYSIWPANRDPPLGWNAIGTAGRKSECLEYIESVWKDMRPLSLRRHMEEMDRHRGAGQEALAGDDPMSEEGNEGPSLLERLSLGRHPVEAALRGPQTATTLKECLERAYLHIRFTQTRGGTELGIRLDQAASQTGLADFENGKGTVHLEGELILDQAKVRCVVDLDVATLRGEGYLVPLADRSN
jgi:uncharacterized protein YbdZ (MbtH family)